MALAAKEKFGPKELEPSDTLLLPWSNKPLQKYQGFMQTKSKGVTLGNKNYKMFLLCL